jgi:hypothetical protein
MVAIEVGETYGTVIVLFALAESAFEKDPGIIYEHSPNILT